MHLPPYVYNNAHSGIEIDIVKAIFDHTDFEISFTQMPRIRMIQTFDQGEFDGVLTQNIAVSDKGCATEWYLKHQNVAFTLSDSDLTITNINQLKTMSVLSFDGAKKYLGSEFETAVSRNPRYSESVNQASHIELIYMKRFDVIVGDEWILRLAQKEHYDRTGVYKKLTAHYIMPPSLYSARFQNTEVCDAFNEALNGLRTSGKYDEIIANYHTRIMVASSER